jgi:hypothetical protein
MGALAVLLAVAALVALAAVAGVLGDRAGDAEAAPWTFGESMSQRRSYVAAADIEGQVYAAGGMVGETGRPLDLLARYDPEADSWETLRRMPEPVRASAAAAVDGVWRAGDRRRHTDAVNAYTRPRTSERARAAPGGEVQSFRGSARREGLRPRRLPRRGRAAHGGRLRPGHGFLVGRPCAPDSQPRLRRRRLRRRDLDDRRQARGRDPH